MTTYIREKLPVILIALLAVAGILLGVVSAATAQNLNHDPRLQPWQGQNANPIPNPNFAPWEPLTETHQSPTGMRPTMIGRAGVIPEKPAPLFPPERLEPLPEVPSLADSKRAGTSAAVRAKTLAQRRVKLPDAVPNFDDLQLNNGEIRSAEVKVLLKGKNTDKEKELTWQFNPVELPIFIDKVHKLDIALGGSVAVTPSGTDYNRLQVRLIGNDGNFYQPVNIYQNRVWIPSINQPHEDQNRDLELWTLGTSKTFAQKDKITSLIKIWSFEDCKALNHTLVDSVPRQCILPDGTTYLEIDQKLSEKDKAIDNFDKCLRAGHPLIVNFPRKCVAPGGRIYIEPPRL